MRTAERIQSEHTSERNSVIAVAVLLPALHLRHPAQLHPHPLRAVDLRSYQWIIRHLNKYLPNGTTKKNKDFKMMLKKTLCQKWLVKLKIITNYVPREWNFTIVWSDRFFSTLKKNMLKKQWVFQDGIKNTQWSEQFYGIFYYNFFFIVLIFLLWRSKHIHDSYSKFYRQQ